MYFISIVNQNPNWILEFTDMTNNFLFLILPKPSFLNNSYDSQEKCCTMFCQSAIHSELAIKTVHWLKIMSINASYYCTRHFSSKWTAVANNKIMTLLKNVKSVIKKEPGFYSQQCSPEGYRLWRWKSAEKEERWRRSGGVVLLLR